MPWETAISEEDAAKALSTFFGGSASDIRPGDVLDLDINQVEALLKATTLSGGNKALDDALFAHSESVSRRFFGTEVYFRGIVEFSNVCEFDCYYCGVRKHQPRTWRYTMPVDEVVGVAEWAFQHEMGTLMLQSGQLTTPERNAYITDMVRRVRERTIELDMEKRGLVKEQILQASVGGGGGASTSASATTNVIATEESVDNLGLCVALSCGELPKSQYQEWKEAGAARYLLRIETSNPELYSTLHPAHQSWDARVKALMDAKEAGFMIGTGVMVGLPGQSLRDLASDILFFRDIGADMIGMGPYITEPGTPAAEMWSNQYGEVDKKAHMRAMVELTTRMNALARVTLGNVNIAATTALQAIEPVGREIALRRGANVLMPILTPTKYRQHYTLYEGKPCINDTAEECQKCLNARLSMVGKKLKPGIWGDPPSFRDRLHPVKMSAAATNASTTTRGYRGMHTSVAHHQQKAGTPACGTCGAPSKEEAPACPVPTGPSFTAAAKSNGPAIYAYGGKPQTLKGSDTPRTNIGIFGRMNAGKSSLMNALTRSEVSIVDSTPGTTADTKIALMELHAAGPVKLFDTAGVDEEGGLGEKKRRKVLATIKECDVAAIVVSLGQLAQSLGGIDTAVEVDDGVLKQALRWERLLVEKANNADALPLLVFNRPTTTTANTDSNPQEAYAKLQERVRKILKGDGGSDLAVHATALAAPSSTLALSQFVEAAAVEANAAHTVPCLPDQYLAENAMIFLNIPMDAETPTMRLLRPQALVQEEAIRRFATTIAYRMNLNDARSGDPVAVEKEKSRFLRALQPALHHDGPAIIITDSQAVDIVHPWTLDPQTGQSIIPFTTFSIAMVHRQSRGALPVFAAGIDAFRHLQPGDKVLVAEACNHNRITELCNDIGMVQIPKKLQAQAGGSGVVVEHAFGREFPEIDDPESGGLGRFKLAVHCGGCMVDPQKIRARVSDLQEAGVPVTNYGLLLAYAHSPDAMKRALEPWGVESSAH